jgi:FKBP-type peptidyl-prolyl cis-trans isomerase 2
MEKIEQGDYVTVTYTGLLKNNEVFESTDNTGPLEFRIGANSVLPGFEKALLGMAVNEIKTIQLPADEAYGPIREELIHTVNRAAFGDKITPEPGIVLGLTVVRDGQKQKVPVMVKEIVGDEVIIDFNHPLAGQDLTYNITVTAVNKKPSDDLA